MTVLNVYTLLHGNLGFSSIPKSQYPVVLDHCYWPMIHLIEQGCKMGLEFPAETLIEISKIDSSFLQTLKGLWQEKKCEIIASGYTQLIMPLVPHVINRKNLELGLEAYGEFLGRKPEVLFIPEQTFSRSIPELALEAGMKALIMDWDNAAEHHHYKMEQRYRPALLEAEKGRTIPIIWNSSMNSFKFQRYIYGRLSLSDYILSLSEHVKEGKRRAYCLYGTDWEIFNYRPVTHEIGGNEIERVKKLFDAIHAKPCFQMTLPSNLIEDFSPSEIIDIASPEIPIPCKNRDDYNVVRWAVSGRDNVHQNTRCYDLTHKMELLENLSSSALKSEDWKKTIHLWGSDFRTKATNEKFYSFSEEYGAAMESVEGRLHYFSEPKTARGDFILTNPFKTDMIQMPVELRITLQKGIFKESPGLEWEGKEIACQCEDMQFYQDQSLREVTLVFNATLLSKESAVVRLLPKSSIKAIPSTVCLNGAEISIKTPSVELVLNTFTGADIRSLSYPSVYDKPFVQYLHPVYFDNIAFSNDYYSGWTQLCDDNGRIFYDTGATRFSPDSGMFKIRVPLFFRHAFKEGFLIKRYNVYLHQPRVDLVNHFFFPYVTPFFLRTGIITVNPEAFDLETLIYSTVNGGKEVESFSLKGRQVQHSQSPTQICSATSCLGATEGWVSVQDQDKGLAVMSPKDRFYSAPMVDFRQIKSSWLLRLYHSMAETDDTGHIAMTGHHEIPLSYKGFKTKDFNQMRQDAFWLNHSLWMQKTSSNLL